MLVSLAALLAVGLAQDKECNTPRQITMKFWKIDPVDKKFRNHTTDFRASGIVQWDDEKRTIYWREEMIDHIDENRKEDVHNFEGLQLPWVNGGQEILAR